jgi:hypothetical protein
MWRHFHVLRDPLTFRLLFFAFVLTPRDGHKTTLFTAHEMLMACR